MVASWPTVGSTGWGASNGSLRAYVDAPAKAGLTTTPGSFRTAVLDPNFFFIGQDSTGRGYFSNGSSGIFQSDDGLLTRSTSKGQPAGTNGSTVKMIDFKGHLYLYCQSTSAGTPAQIWRTDRSGTLGTDSTAFVWTGPQWTGASGSTVAVSTGFNADATYMYVAEYGDPVGGPSAYRSSDGTTWTQIVTASTANRHIHAINPDPYIPGDVWMTWGDGGSKIIQVSHDYGSTWTEVANGAANWQAVQISFTSTHVWFAADNRFSSAFVWDKTAGTLYDASVSSHRLIAVPGAIPRNGPNRVTDGAFTSGSKTHTSATAAFTSDDAGREVFNPNLPNGRSWVVTVTNATTVQLFDAATATVTAQTVQYADEQFFANADLGVVDPTTGAFYCCCTLGPGQRVGWFYVPSVGAPVQLIDGTAQIPQGSFWEVAIHKGRVWCGKWSIPQRA